MTFINLWEENNLLFFLFFLKLFSLASLSQQGVLRLFPGLFLGRRKEGSLHLAQLNADSQCCCVRSQDKKKKCSNASHPNRCSLFKTLQTLWLIPFIPPLYLVGNIPPKVTQQTLDVDLPLTFLPLFPTLGERCLMMNFEMTKSHDFLIPLV